MRIIILTNEKHVGDSALRIAQWLREYEQGHTVSLSVQSPDSIDFSIYSLAISWLYSHIITPRHFNALKYGAINVHTGYLPWCRGAHPNVWAIVDQTIAGVTIHKIDKSIDAGPIIARKGVDISPLDTGETLYKRLIETAIFTFKSEWPRIRNDLENNNLEFIQDPRVRKGSYHYAADVKEVDDLESQFGTDTIHDIVNVLRARTFRGHKSAYIRDKEGNKVYVRVNLSYE
jgi:methionyl-tRNA formyltransferase